MMPRPYPDQLTALAPAATPTAAAIDTPHPRVAMPGTVTSDREPHDWRRSLSDGRLRGPLALARGQHTPVGTTQTKGPRRHDGRVE